MNTDFRILCWCGVFLLGSMLLTACTYGPPRINMSIENVRAQPGSHIVAVSVKYQQFRKPTGINTFPNGGVPRMLDEQARIYLCDLDSLEVKRVVSMSPGDGMKTSWQPWVLGWANGDLYFKLTGRAGTTFKDIENSNTVLYKISMDGKLSGVQAVPDGIAFQHNSGPLPQGVYVRVSKGHDHINFKTELFKEWQTMFKTDNTEGELVPVRMIKVVGDN